MFESILSELLYALRSFHDFLWEVAELLISSSSEPSVFVRMFWAFCFLDLPRYFLADLVVLFVYLRNKNREPEKGLDGPRPLVSVIIPALNESETIEQTVVSLLEQSYENLEIVVVDDGSVDGTTQLCRRFERNGLIKFAQLGERQGKGAALNYGISISQGDYFVFMDADSTLERQAVEKLIEEFRDPSTGAVSGNILVKNSRQNLLTRFQTIEYMISLTVGRWFRALSGILGTVPGALGAFRRETLVRIGGHEPGPGNDSDLTVRIRKLHRRISFSSEAICLTTVPDRWAAFIRQRLRWNRNHVRNRFRKHRDILNPLQANFTWRNFASTLDTLFFTCTVPFIWLTYFVDVLWNHSDRYPIVLFASFFLHLTLRAVQFGIALAVSPRARQNYPLVLLIPLFSFFKLFQRLVRIIAVLEELLFRSSYRDPFAPERVREQMEVY